MGLFIAWAIGAFLTGVALYPELAEEARSTDREAVAGLLLLVFIIAIWPLMWLTAAVLWMVNR